MLYLCLYVVSVVLFNQALRFGQRSQTRALAVVAVNYVVAAAVSFGFFLANGAQWGHLGRWPVLAFGIPEGVMYFAHALVILEAYAIAGVGITSALISSGIVVPVLVSWYAWGEQMSPWKWLAVALIPVTMYLLRPRRGAHPHLTLKADIVLFLAFLIAGILTTVHKAFNVYSPEGRPAYQWVLFSLAAASSVSYVLVRGVGCARRELVVGAGAGGVNALATFFILLGLSVVPAVIFYPVSASLIIVLNTAAAGLLWKERLTGRQIAGMLIAIVIVVLARK